MAPIRIAINGFGRIGRIFTRIAWDDPRFQIVAINSRSGADMYAHLLQYDSIYGRWDKTVSFEGNDALIIDGMRVPIHHENELERAPWGQYDVDIVLESTGAFHDRASSETHLRSGAKYVVISAPAEKEDKTMVFGINHEEFDPAVHKIVSAASCTTTCLAPVVKVLHEHFGVKRGTVITTHAYTNDQHLVDHPHKKNSFRRSRASAVSIIPTSTGAAKAIGKVIPEMQGKLDGNAIRVPVPVGSILSFVAEVEKPTTREEVNERFHAAVASFPGSLAVSDVGLVSVDYVGTKEGCHVDTLSTLVTDRTQVFVQAWYDNEWGYVSQMAELIAYMGERAKQLQ